MDITGSPSLNACCPTLYFWAPIDEQRGKETGKTECPCRSLHYPAERNFFRNSSLKGAPRNTNGVLINVVPCCSICMIKKSCTLGKQRSTPRSRYVSVAMTKRKVIKLQGIYSLLWSGLPRANGTGRGRSRRDKDVMLTEDSIR